MADEHGPYIDADAPDTDLTIRGVAVRLYPDGPQIHANAGHIATGVVSVHIDPSDGYLWIIHDALTPVVAVLCAPDETLTSRGIAAGGSGGTDKTRVLFTANEATGPRPLDLRDPDDYALVAGPSSNLWYAVIQVRARTQGGPAPVDVLATHHAALAARVNLLEQGTPAPLLAQTLALTQAIEAELAAREAGPLA